MATYCDFAIPEHGQYINLKCTIDNGACGYWRWCTTDGCIKQTNGFIDCVPRRRKMQEQKEKIERISSIKNIPKGKESGKKKYKVVVACEKFVIYVGEDGQNVKLYGDFKVKAEDFLEI